LPENWPGCGFNAFKFAPPVADDGPARELETLRQALGPSALIAADMHWNQSADQALFAALARDHGSDLLPHATIGSGIFLAASLHAASTSNIIRYHEFQHPIFEPDRQLLRGDMDCKEGVYTLPTGPGPGVEPSQQALTLVGPL
jgi:galactonate dehydratase